MPDRILDLRLVRFALTSAEYGSFSRAAETLNIRASTVSKGVRNLEYRVGADLFERHHAGVRLTPAGDRFVKEANVGFDHLKSAMRQAGALHRGEEGQLAVVVSVPLLLLGESFELFRKRYAGASIEVIESTTRAGLALVEQRKVDVAFVARTRDRIATQSLFLWDKHMTVLLPKAHALAGANKLKLEDLRNENLVLTAGGLGPDIHEYVVREMSQTGVQPKVQLHRVSQCNLITMVAMGFGATIIVGPLSRAVPEEVVLVPLEGRNIVSLCAVWNESNPNPLLKGMLEMLKDSGRVQPIV